MLKLFIIFISFSVLLILPFTSHAKLSQEEQRTIFLQAEKALKKKHLTQYKKLSAQLSTYPLQVYLRYQEYTQNLSKLSAKKVKAFLTQYKDTPLASRLQNKWLLQQAKRKQWQSFLAIYNPFTAMRNTSLQCFYLQALLHTGKKKQAFAKVKSLWNVGKSQKKACDPVFKAWKKAGKLTTDLLLKRIQLTIKAGNTSLTAYLSQSLPKKERQWINVWLKVHNNPQLARKKNLFKKNNPYTHAILLHAVLRQNRRNTQSAIKLWHTLTKRYTFTHQEKAQIQRTIGLKMAYKHQAEAITWLAKVPAKEHTKASLAWYIRTAIRYEKIPALQRALTLLSPTARLKDHWQYWLASIEKKPTVQQKKYSQLAQKRSYYGFLAADKLDLNYKFNHTPIKTTSKQLQQLSTLPIVQRIQELFILKRIINAKREWYHFIKQSNDIQIQHLAKLLQQWGWYQQAIFTVAKSSHHNDLSIRFPLLYRKAIERYSKQRKLETAVTYSVIRRESAFSPIAYSSVGARGLMQLMPATAKAMAKKLKLSYKRKQQLFDTNLNVKLGTYYLKQVLNRYKQHLALGFASYNAGPHRVKSWLPKSTLPADQWIETIPFTETREYVKNILAYIAIYEHLLKKTPTRLKQRLPDIKNHY